VGVGRQGGEMAQTMYAHMNKWIKEISSTLNLFPGYHYCYELIELYCGLELGVSFCLEFN
jgi:hypothetical protein